MPPQRPLKRRDNKIAVYIENACFVCGNVLFGAQSSIVHLGSQHNVCIKPPKNDVKRPKSKCFRFVTNNPNSKHSIVRRYGCRSC